MIEQDKNYVWIDRLIYFFVIMFLSTLTNSIFFNQLGYYGALILILIKYYLNRQNPFTKTGLEIFILFYLLATSIFFGQWLYDGIIFCTSFGTKYERSIYEIFSPLVISQIDTANRIVLFLLSYNYLHIR